MKTKLFLTVLAFFLITGLSCCVKDDKYMGAEPASEANTAKYSNNDSIAIYSDITYGSVSDIDGNTYKTVKIGNQIWMAENLRSTMYNDGSKIPLGYGAPAGYTDWFNYGNSDYRWAGGAYCWFENEIGYKYTFGALYNWHAVGQGNLCPKGWHVPANDEWTALITFLGGVVEPFNEVTENAMIYCSAENIEKSGFAPIRTGELNGWGFIENGGFWWSATPRPSEGSVPFGYLFNFSIMSFEPKSYGYSVRCLKD